MSSSASSNSTQIITNVVFGATATAISIVTVYQGHKVWKMWREYARRQGNVAPDIELGLQSFHSTPTNLEAVEHEEDITTSATPANHAGDVVSDHLHVSVQLPELQPTLSTPVEAETSLSPAMVSGGGVEGNELPTVHTETAQLASTAMERQHSHPVANEHLRSQPESEA